MHEQRTFDRLVPPDWEHVEKYPLRGLAEKPVGVPVVAGINWYTDFDTPVRVHNRWWVCPDGKISGTIRGGHCICLASNETDLASWWHFYNQGNEGACVGFGSSRMMTDLNRHEYDGFWLYHKAQEIGGYPGTEGAYVRDALKALQTIGPVRHRESEPRLEDGIEAYRWATTIDEVVTALDHGSVTRLEAVPILNSWGEDYPHITYMPLPVFERLMNEDGEVGLVTDK